MMNNGNDGLFGQDDPNRGPLDRAANAVTGHTGGIDAAIGEDDPNRGPIDRATNALTGDGSAFGGSANGDVLSAIFDSRAEAERAVADLRNAGVDEGALSVVTQGDETANTAERSDTVEDGHHENLVRGILGGGALGAGLGVLALAIPGVGPLVAAGAIAASAVPGALAIGAAAGAAAGSLNETLKDHGVSDEDVAYYGEHLGRGGVLITVRGAANPDEARQILRQNGGHSVGNARLAAA